MSSTPLRLIQISRPMATCSRQIFKHQTLSPSIFSKNNLQGTRRQSSSSFYNNEASARETRSKKRLLWEIVIANGLIFGAWQLTSWRTQSREGRDLQVRMFRTLRDNFMISLKNVRDGRYWTLLTNAISHRDLWHCGVNVFVFYQIGKIFMWTPGLKAGRHLAPLILGSALSASAAFLIHTTTNSPRLGQERYGLGLSGVVSGMITAAACLAPWQRMLVFGVIPAPLWVIGIGYILYDTNMLHESDHQKGGGMAIAHDAHIGGAIFGAAFYAVVLRRFGGILGPGSLASWRRIG